MRTVWVVEDRESNSARWSQCSTYTDHAEALARLRYEAASMPSSEQLVFLNNSRLRTASGYQMRIDRVECSTDA